MKIDALYPLVRAALAEDIGGLDITTEYTVDPASRCKAVLRAKQDGVLSGMEVFQAVFDCLSADRGEPSINDWTLIENGARFSAGDILASFTANTRVALTGERCAMNFVQHLAGVATLTARYVAAVDGLPVKVCDTRKTTPLLRDLEKAAVLHGGGYNHRRTLHGGVLIKENHIQAAGGVVEALDRVQRQTPLLTGVEIEVTNLDEFARALDGGATIIMLDNMSLDDMKEAVARAQDKPVALEASGNVGLDRIRAIAETGVDIISVGTLTHSAPAADLTLLIGDA